MHAQTASPAAFCAYLTRHSSAFARQTQICNSNTDRSPAKQRVLVVRQLQKRSGNSLLCSASGGLLGGLKKAFGGKKEKLPRKSRNVEFPPCRYLQLTCHIFCKSHVQFTTADLVTRFSQIAESCLSYHRCWICLQDIEKHQRL